MINFAFPPSPRRVSRRLWVALATLVATLVVVPGVAGAAEFHATPSTFASMFSQAQGGDTVFLASGSYGSWNGGAKSGMVVVAAEPGASPSMAGGDFGSSVRNITIRGVTFTGPVEVAPGSTPLNLVFDGDTWGNVGHAAHEGRLSIVGGGSSAIGGNGVQVKNSTFGPGGCSDGIQDSSNGTEIGPNNEFKGILQGNCAEHADAIQPYASNYIYIHDNYLHDNEQGIMSPDGVSTGYRITNNVIHTSTGYPCMHLGDTRNGSVTHNVCRNGSIRVFGGNQNQPSQNMVVRDNAAGIDASACSGCTIDHNQTVTYTGGTGRCAYATASPKGTASDGTDIGLNDCGATQPPPPPPSDTTPPDTTITSGPTGTTTDNSPTFAFTATESGSVFECRVDSGAWADCTSPWTTAALSDGAHSVSVRATDVAGNTDASPATRSFTVSTALPPDTTPPDTTITSGPTGTTTDNSPTFAFTATEANSVFECRVDSGAWADCTSPWTTAALGDGAHSVSVRATDVTGNTDASPATRSFTVSTTTPPPADTTAPETTISSGPTGTTSATTASFAFTSSESGSTFECKLDTGAWATCTSPKAYSGLTTGSHTFSVRATDAASNTDASPATQTWTIQSAPADHQPVAAYTYTPASPTIGQAVSFDASTATCDDTPCTYTWEDDGGDGPAGDQWPLGSGKTMSFTFQEAGVKNVRVTVTDVDGDTATTMKAITVGAAAPPADTTAPDTTISSGPTATTSDTTPTFAFTASEAGSTFQCQLDSGAWASCTSPWTTTTLADGPHSVSVRATDAAGNVDATPATRAFTVDTTPPADTTAPNTTIGSGPTGPTNDSTPTFAFTASESASTFQCRVDTGSWATCTSPWTTAALGDGAHSVSVRATDVAGNTDASPATRSFTVDTSAPNTTISSAPPALSPGSSATVAFSASESGATFECRLDGGAWAACTSPKTYTGLNLAQHTVEVRATDAAGNVEASPAGATWTSIALPGGGGSGTGSGSGSGVSGSGSDDEAPTVTLSAPAPGATFTSTLNMAATASDNRGVSRVEFWFDGARVSRDTAAPYAATFAASRTTSYGVHTVVVRAFDFAGNARSTAVTVTRVRTSAAPHHGARSASAQARAASASDTRQSTLVPVSMWRIGTAPADGDGTLLRGRGMPGGSASVSLTRCGDSSGAAAVMQLNAGADGTLYARQPADGLCVLRIKPFGEA
ncbi:MAG: Ig-like domain-containing protein [Solirubrobacteraceae bacterium]